MPAVFFGHGSPMNTLERNAHTDAWQAFGRAMPRPRAILAISAHWYIRETAVTAMPTSASKEKPPGTASASGGEAASARCSPSFSYESGTVPAPPGSGEEGASQATRNALIKSAGTRAAPPKRHAAEAELERHIRDYYEVLGCFNSDY